MGTQQQWIELPLLLWRVCWPCYHLCLGVGLNCLGQQCGIICHGYWGDNRVHGIICIMESLRFPWSYASHEMDGKVFIVIIHPVLESEQGSSYLHRDDGVLIIVEVYGLCSPFAINALVVS